MCNNHDRRGGGVAFLLANHVHYTVCSDLYFGKIESLWLQLFPGSKSEQVIYVDLLCL